MVKLTTAQKWLRTIIWLRRNFPAQRRVVIRSMRKMKWQGEALLHGKLFSIEVNKEQSFNLRIDALIHEWAHILTWFGESFQAEEHSAEWGIAYAKIYRTWLEWNYGCAKIESH